MTHDNTSAVMSKFKGIGAKKIHDPQQLVFALDHDIQNQDEANQKKYRAIEAFAKEHGVDFYPAGSGIGHQIMVERGYVVPGSFVVASDSHSNMYGALGAIGTPIVRTDAAAVWATGEFWWQIPRSIQVVLEGKLPAGVTGKDVIITLCGLYNHDECLNAAVEFTGPGVASLSMDARLSISNMTTEWGPLVGWFPVDAVTIEYMRGVQQRLKAHWASSASPTATLRAGTKNPPAPDADATYAARITLDLAQVTPHVSGPDTVQVMQSLAEIEKKKVAIQKAYLISCVNSRLEDLEAAAKVLKGKKVASGREVLPECGQQVGAGRSRAKRGIWQTLMDAGRTAAACRVAVRASAWASACSRQARSASRPPIATSKAAWDRATRSAIWRVRRSSRHRRSPDTFAGRTSSRTVLRSARTRNWLRRPAARRKLKSCPAFPQRVKGRLVFMPQDNVNTDAIYGKDYTYRDDMTPEMMAKVVMENYDPQFAARTQCRRCDRQRVQLRHRVEPRAGGDVPEGERHSAGDRGQLLADVSAQCV